MTLPTQDRPHISIQRSLAQDRASFAFNSVERVNLALREKYKQLARSAPADVQTNGLGQTLAFWRAKGEPEHRLLLDHLTTWLREQLHFNEGQDALKWIVLTANIEEYRRATTETIALLTWIKRFAEGY